MSYRVKEKVIELLYSWSQVLVHEPKIKEAYQMLRRQGIIKQDPAYVDRVNHTCIMIELFMEKEGYVYLYLLGEYGILLRVIMNLLKTEEYIGTVFHSFNCMFSRVPPNILVFSYWSVVNFVKI